MESSQRLQAINPGELELIITCASTSNIKSLGCTAWIEWHQRFQRLHQQAVWEAMSSEEEVTKETIVSNGKIPLLIHEAICISLWRVRIFPRILSLDKAINCSFLLYAILYHETVAVGLLELIVFDEEACQSISELVIDLIDYCIEMIMDLIDLVNTGYLKSDSNNTEKNNDYEDLEKQQKNLQFDIGIRCITIISCLINALEKIHISATGRLYSTHDTLLLMVELLQLEPWHRKEDDGKICHYIEGKWKNVGEDEDKMCKAETLTWLAVWRLMLNTEFGNHYDMNDFRKGKLCKLLYRITEDRIDQMPILSDLKRSLGQLAVMNMTYGHQSKQQPVMIEVLPQIKPSILKIISKKEKTIAKMQLQDYFHPDTDQIIELAKKLSVSYTSELLEHMDNGGPTCTLCKERAFKKCSRCKNDWYCGRECQVKDWNRHKTMCDELVSNV